MISSHPVLGLCFSRHDSISFKNRAVLFLFQGCLSFLLCAVVFNSIVPSLDSSCISTGCGQINIGNITQFIMVCVTVSLIEAVAAVALTAYSNGKYDTSTWNMTKRNIFQAISTASMLGVLIGCILTIKSTAAVALSIFAIVGAAAWVVCQILAFPAHYIFRSGLRATKQDAMARAYQFKIEKRGSSGMMAVEVKFDCDEVRPAFIANNKAPVIPVLVHRPAPPNVESILKPGRERDDDAERDKKLRSRASNKSLAKKRRTNKAAVTGSPTSFEFSTRDRSAFDSEDASDKQQISYTAVEKYAPSGAHGEEGEDGWAEMKAELSPVYHDGAIASARGDAATSGAKVIMTSPKAMALMLRRGGFQPTTTVLDLNKSIAVDIDVPTVDEAMSVRSV